MSKKLILPSSAEKPVCKEDAKGRLLVETIEDGKVVTRRFSSLPKVPNRKDMREAAREPKARTEVTGVDTEGNLEYHGSALTKTAMRVRAKRRHGRNRSAKQARKASR